MSEKDLLSVGLGISELNLSRIKKMGFKTVVRLKNSNRLSDELVKQKLLSFTDLSPENLIIFDGDAVLGYPTQIPLIIDKMKDKQIKLGVIEFLINMA